MSTIGDFLVELFKAERDKHLIETIKQGALNPDKPIKITGKMIKLTEQELEEVFDKIDASEEEREIWRNIYFKQEKINESN